MSHLKHELARTQNELRWARIQRVSISQVERWAETQVGVSLVMDVKLLVGRVDSIVDNLEMKEKRLVEAMAREEDENNDV